MTKKVDPLPRAWLVLAFGEERQYGGNAGYNDIFGSHYRYDSSVPNHKRPVVGDALVVRAPKALQGFARIESIERREAFKDRLRCPICHTTAIKTRLTLIPKCRCDRGHEFEDPVKDPALVTEFTASYGSSFLAAPNQISISTLRAACPAWNGQLAIQAISLDSLRSELDKIPDFFSKFIAIEFA